MLLTLGLLIASSGNSPLSATAGRLAPNSHSRQLLSPTVSPAAATLILTIDGEQIPVREATLSRAPAGGFIMGFESANLDISITGSLKAPVAARTYAIHDTLMSNIIVSAKLPPRFNKSLLDPDGSYWSSLGYKEGSPLALVFDWGKGMQELRGRQLGQFIFTRVANATADGSFEVTVYGITASQNIQYKGVPRGFQRLTGRQVKGTFKNLPINDVGKAMDDLQKALKGFK